MSVDVPNLFRFHLGASERQLHAPRGAHSLRRRRSDVVCVGIRAVPYQLGQDHRAAALGMLELFKNHHPGALSFHEAIPIEIERPTGEGRLVVPSGERLHHREPADSQRRNRRFRPSGNHRVGLPQPDRFPSFTDRMRAGGTCGNRRPVGAPGPKADADQSGRHVDDHLNDEKRRQAVEALLQRLLVLFLERANPADPGPDDHPNLLGIVTVWLVGSDHHSAFGDRHVGRGNRILGEEIHSSDLSFFDELLGIEVFHFTGDACVQILGWEPGDRTNP